MSSPECTSDGILDLKREERGAWPLLHFSSSFCISLSRSAIPSWHVLFRRQEAGLIMPHGRWAKIGDLSPVWHKILNSFLRHPLLHLPLEPISICSSRKYQ